jgi:uncharacterized cupin superfamily protein
VSYENWESLRVCQDIIEGMDQNRVERNWSERGFSCGLWTDPPGQRWENFIHKTDEVVMVVDGTVEFEIGGKTYHPQSG